MDFLVILRQDWGALRERDDLPELVGRERAVGRTLMSEGVLRHIWRLPGERANVGIWRAADATDLHAQLERLPMRRWLDAQVTALARHELDSTPREPGSTPREPESETR